MIKSGGSIVNDIDLNSHYLKNVSSPIEDYDAANKKYVDTVLIATGNIPKPTEADKGKVLMVKEDGTVGWVINKKQDIRTALDDVAVAGAQYYLGEQTEVHIVLPDNADMGQIVFVSWYNGDTAATLSITGPMLDFDFAPSANTRSEINALWDGRYWAVLGNEMNVPSEVTV